MVMSCVDTKHLFVDGAKEWALHYFFNEFEGKRKPSWVAGHLRSINKRVFGKLTASHLRVWVSRWKKDHRGQRPGQPTEQPGGAPKKGGRQATFSDEQLRKLGNQLKAYLKVNPVGTDAPTLAAEEEAMIGKRRVELAPGGGNLPMASYKIVSVSYYRPARRKVVWYYEESDPRFPGGFPVIDDPKKRYSKITRM